MSADSARYARPSDTIRRRDVPAATPDRPGPCTAEDLESLPEAIGKYTFSDVFTTPVRKAAHGDSSGVRGAAWLWPLRRP